MYKKLFSLLLGMCMIFSVFAVSPAMATNDNMIEDGGFESGTLSDKWHWYDTNQATTTIVEDKVAEGTKALKVETGSLTGTAYLQYETQNITSGETVRISLDVLRTSQSYGCIMYVNVTGTDYFVQPSLPLVTYDGSTTDYITYTTDITFDVKAEKALFQIRFNKGIGDVYIDNISMSYPSSEPPVEVEGNLILDGSFESGTLSSAWSDSSVAWGGKAYDTIEIVSTAASAGSKSLHLVSTGKNSYYSYNITENIVPGQTLHYSADVKRSDSTQYNLYMYLAFYDASGGPLFPQDSVYLNRDFATAANGEWMTVAKDTVVLEGAASAKLFFRTTKDGGCDFYLDNLSVVPIITDESIIQSLNGLKTTEEIYNALKTHSEKIGIEIEEGSDFADLSEESQENVLLAFINKSFKTLDEIKELFCIELIIENINSAENANKVYDALKTHSEKIGIEIGEDSYFAGLSETSQEKVLSAFTDKSFETLDEIKDLFSAEITIEIINSAENASEVHDVLKIHSEKIGIEIGEDSYFAGLSETSRDKVLSLFINKDFENIDEIKDLFSAEVATEIMNSAENAAEAFEAQSEALGLDTDEGSLYAELDDAGKEEAINAISKKDFKDSTALKYEFGKTVVLLSLNNITEDNLDKLDELLLVIDAESYAEIDMKNYNSDNVSNLKKLRFLKAIANKAPYASFNSFATEFKKADKEYLVKKEQSSTGSSTGSSGSGGYTYTTQKPEPVKKSNFDDLGAVPWAEESINRLAEKGIINGVADRTFAPQNVVTREQFVKMLAGALKLSAGTGTEFSDVSADSVYASFISAAFNAGIVTGIDDKTFGMGMNITREQMAAMLFRALDVLKIETENIRENISFTDEAEISQYAKAAVLKLYAGGIINGMGNGRFAPKNTATRAEAAKMLDTFLEVSSK